MSGEVLDGLAEMAQRREGDMPSPLPGSRWTRRPDVADVSRLVRQAGADSFKALYPEQIAAAGGSVPGTDFSLMDSIDETAVRNLSKRVLVANRGEIAVRVFRAASEQGLESVAIYHEADKLGAHRHRADIAVELDSKLSPVGAYLDIPEIIRAAKHARADIVHPGYGFLSESAEFAKAVEDAGMVWAGPPPGVIERLGSKTAARAVAQECGVPCVPGTKSAVSGADEVMKFADEFGLPIMLKAEYGGGGRGIRPVFKREDIAETFANATSECKAAFGNGSMFVERMVVQPRHIEVQVLFDAEGNGVHLYERDCSVQRRNQKVVEQAPAQHLDPKVRDAICANAVKLCKMVGYRSAGTVEFLLDQKTNEFFFMEVNPRIQVEHTVTEEVTLVDIVGSQLAIACGAKLSDLGINDQSDVHCNGFAMQCRVTTEDPARDFAPDTGRITKYRTPGGPGVRLDGGPGFTGAVITPHYDSLLVKLTCRAVNFTACVRKMLRALLECSVRGVKTNISFLLNVLRHREFLTGHVHTQWVADTPSLFDLPFLGVPLQNTMAFLGEVAVNGSVIDGSHGLPGPPPVNIPLVSRDDLKEVPTGWRDILKKDGPAGFAKAVRAHKGLLLTDTTWRDAHQSLLMTRVRTKDMAVVAPATSRILKNCFSLEMWGGATFDVSMRFLHECPWERLEKLRRLVPNIPFQMLLRGANAVGYTAYPDNVVYEFCKTACEKGIDVFRIFDSLNGIDNMKLGIDAVVKAGGVAEAAICYTGDVESAESDPEHKSKYDLKYYMTLAEQLIEAGAHVLGIKDMAGLLRPRSAKLLVSALRKKFPDIPIHVHTHDTAGTGVASMLACYEAGADAVDSALDTMSGTTSQPSMGAIVGAVAGDEGDCGIKLEEIQPLCEYWEEARRMYGCFDPGLKSGNADVYLHEMPGGQYTNLQFQSMSLGMAAQWPAVKRAYAQANQMLGDIVKVTPSSKVVGDLAQFLVGSDLSAAEATERAETLSFPKSVVEFLRGDLGVPTGGFPEPLRSRVLGSTPRIDGRPGAGLPPMDLAKLKEDLVAKHGAEMIRDHDVLSAALYPQVFDDFCDFRKAYGDVSVLPTPALLAPLEPGVELHYDSKSGRRHFVKLVSVGPPHHETGECDVFFECDGEGRNVVVVDRALHAASPSKKRPQADAAVDGQVGAPLGGVVVEVRVKEGQTVSAGTPVCVMSAMKMETVVVAPVGGVILELHAHTGDSLAAKDLIVIIH
jgi:pyruvate carboxylase